MFTKSSQKSTKSSNFLQKANKYFFSLSPVKRLIPVLITALLITLGLQINLRAAGDTICVNIVANECAAQGGATGSDAVEFSDGSSVDGIKFGSFRTDLIGTGNTEVSIKSVGTDNGVTPRVGPKMAKFSKAGPYTHRAELTDDSFNHPLKDTTGTRFNYWYGWSLYIPNDANWGYTQDWSQFLGQWRYSNINGCFNTVTPDNKFIGGSGLDLAAENGRLVLVDVPYSDEGPGRGTDQQEHDLGPLVKGQWVDFIMQAKWSGKADGEMKFWMNTGSGYNMILDRYHVANWIDTYSVAGTCSVSGQDMSAPNWQVGLYAGDDATPLESPRIYYADEMREYRTTVDAYEGGEAWNKVLR
jgi:Polysaccharide lyase